jgi:hypothetical protein
MENAENAEGREKSTVFSASLRVFCGYKGVIESFLACSVFDIVFECFTVVILNYVSILESKH